jgi:hypothetical protein
MTGGDRHFSSDLNAIPNGRFASAAAGKDQNAPVAIVDGVSKSRSGNAIQVKAKTSIATLARSI